MEADGKRYTDEDLKNYRWLKKGAEEILIMHKYKLCAQRDLQQKVAKFLKDEGAAVILEPSRGTYGTIFVQGGGSYRKIQNAIAICGCFC